jgi:hypothetical protein
LFTLVCGDNRPIIFPQHLESSKSTTAKQGKLLNKGSIKLCDISGIIVEPNILAQKGIVFYPPIYFKIVNVTKFHHHQALHWIAAEGEVETCSLLPVDVNHPVIQQFPLKVLLFNKIMHTTRVLKECPALPQQHVRVMHNVRNKGCAIAGMKLLQCIVNYLLKCPCVGGKNTGKIVRHLAGVSKYRNDNDDLVASLQTNNILGGETLVNRLEDGWLMIRVWGDISLFINMAEWVPGREGVKKDRLTRTGVVAVAVVGVTVAHLFKAGVNKSNATDCFPTLSVKEDFTLQHSWCGWVVRPTP